MYSEVDCYKLKTNSSYICTSIALPSFMGDRVELTWSISDPKPNTIDVGSRRRGRSYRSVCYIDGPYPHPKNKSGSHGITIKEI